MTNPLHGSCRPQRCGGARPVRWISAAGAALALAATLLVGGGAPASAAPLDVVPSGAVSDDGSRVVSQQQVGDNLVDLTVASRSLGRDAKVRVLLPEGWSPEQTFPTLWLMHGCCEAADYESWTRFTDAADFLADKGVIAVMPTAGYNGFFTDWRSSSSTNGWQTFHMEEVAQILQRAYGAGPRQAIGGISIGGYGAFEYAADYPGRFSFAASWSGMPDPQFPGATQVVQAIMLRGGDDRNALWGNPLWNFSTWRANNPAAKLSKLRSTELYLSAGIGFDTPLSIDPIEPISLGVSQQFAARARLAGLDVTTNWYGFGTHAWPYWEDELHRTWPRIADSLGLA